MLTDRIAYTDEMLAAIFRRNLNTVRMALRVFEGYGMIEVINNAVTIPNWSKHQTLDLIEQRRGYQREYMAKKRAEQKLLTECKPNCKPNCETNVRPIEEEVEVEEEIEIEKEKDKKKNNINSSKSLDVDLDFEEFWKEYPRKEGKTACLKNWKARIKEKVKPRDLIQAAKNYAIAMSGKELNFVKLPTTFLSTNKGYEDYVNWEGKGNGRVETHTQSNEDGWNFLSDEYFGNAGPKT